MIHNLFAVYDDLPPWTTTISAAANPPATKVGEAAAI